MLHKKHLTNDIKANRRKSNSIKLRNKINSDEGVYEWQDATEIFICLYKLVRINDSPAYTIIGVASLDIERDHWSVKRAWAPLNGKRFYHLLVAISAPHGLTPCKEPGHIVPKASAIWKYMYDSEDFDVREVNGHHLDQWLNAAYFVKNVTLDLNAARERHKKWTQERPRWLSRLFQRLLNHDSLFLMLKEENIRKSAREKLREVTDLYSPGEDGHLSIARHVARSLAKKIKEISPKSFSSITLEKGTNIYGFPLTGGTYLLSRDESMARKLAPYLGSSIEHIALPTPVNLYELPDLSMIIDNDQELRRLVGLRLGDHPYWLIGAHWSLIIDELGLSSCAGIASGQFLFILLSQLKTK